MLKNKERKNILEENRLKIEKLNEVLKNFQENSDRTVLIDGPWGCGKTHCILDFLNAK